MEGPFAAGLVLIMFHLGLRKDIRNNPRMGDVQPVKLALEGHLSDEEVLTKLIRRVKEINNSLSPSMQSCLRSGYTPS